MYTLAFYSLEKDREIWVILSFCHSVLLKELPEKKITEKKKKGKCKFSGQL